MKKKMMAAVLYGPDDIRYQEWPVPSITEGEVLIKVEATGNCGSDLQRIMTVGTWVLPCIPGHEFSGQVVAVGSEDDGHLLGKRVTASPQIPCMKCDWCKAGQYNLCEDYDYVGSRSDGSFAEYIKILAANARVIPDTLSFEEASMTDPVCVALHGIKRSGGIRPGDTVVVMGTGPIGMLAVQWAKVLGAKQVLAVDIFDGKLKIAAELGATHIINAKKENVEKRIFELTENKGGDLYIETAGTIETNIQALNSAAKRGRIVHIGRIYSDVTFSPEVWANIFRKELSIIGSVNFNSAPTDDEWKIALHYMGTGEIQTLPLITHRLKMEEVGKTFKQMFNREIEYNKIIFSN